MNNQPPISQEALILGTSFFFMMCIAALVVVGFVAFMLDISRTEALNQYMGGEISREALEYRIGEGILLGEPVYADHVEVLLYEG